MRVRNSITLVMVDEIIVILPVPVENEGDYAIAHPADAEGVYLISKYRSSAPVLLVWILKSETLNVWWYLMMSSSQ